MGFSRTLSTPPCLWFSVGMQDYSKDRQLAIRDALDYTVRAAATDRYYSLYGSRGKGDGCPAAALRRSR